MKLFDFRRIFRMGRNRNWWEGNNVCVDREEAAGDLGTYQN